MPSAGMHLNANPVVGDQARSWGLRPSRYGDRSLASAGTNGLPVSWLHTTGIRDSAEPPQYKSVSASWPLSPGPSGSSTSPPSTNHVREQAAKLSSFSPQASGPAQDKPTSVRDKRSPVSKCVGPPCSAPRQRSKSRRPEKVPDCLKNACRHNYANNKCSPSR